MPDIVLTTLNARYWHSSFGLRYLYANLGELKNSTVMLEFGINQKSVEMIAEILKHRPRILGIGVYIWNVEQVERLVFDMKRIRPDLTIVLGGPEVSYETSQQRIVDAADYVITGEADISFRQFCEQLLAGDRPTEKIVPAPLPQLTELELPYELYTAEDIAHRVIYVEVSRGCPFTCEFCLSALEIPVRQVPLDKFLAAMQALLDRGAKQFKFVDRTFNLNLRVSAAILEFFLDRYQPGLFLHFEMIPDRLPESLRALIQRFPAGALQFEIGVQTFNNEVGELISRQQDVIKLEDNFRFLRQETGVHIHADLIVGLPGEDEVSFATGFDRLVALQPHEIQVGILKRLKGTPIIRHDESWGMVYSEFPPYEILANQLLSFADIHRLRRFARYWDLVGNSGNFVESLELIWWQRTPYAGFKEFSEWLYEREQQTHGIPLLRLTERVFEFIVQSGVDRVAAALAIWRDYTRGGREDVPRFLRGFDLPPPLTKQRAAALPQRQARHLTQEQE